MVFVMLEEGGEIIIVFGDEDCFVEFVFVIMVVGLFEIFVLLIVNREVKNSVVLVNELVWVMIFVVDMFGSLL